MKGKCTGGRVGQWLLIIGGLNWLLVGIGMLFAGGQNWNVVNLLLGSVSWLEAVIYLLVGLTALMALFGGCGCGKCKGGTCDSGSNQM